MVKLDKIYTRGGDKGYTSLGDGTRVKKNNQRVLVYGELDEANAVIGMCINYCQNFPAAHCSPFDSFNISKNYDRE